MSVISKVINHLTAGQQEERKAELYRNLIRHEAKIGGELFGTIPEGSRREFFCLDPNTWIWHEEWLDKAGQRRIRTTRYDVRPNDILKAQDGQHYQSLSLNEARSLFQAIDLYERRVKAELYPFAL